MTVVRVASVSYDVVVAATLRIVGASTDRVVNDGMGPSTETRLRPLLSDWPKYWSDSEDAKMGLSAIGGERELASFAGPNAETAGETGNILAPPRTLETDSERREPELVVWTREREERPDDMEPDKPFERREPGADPETEERESGLNKERME